MSTHWWRAYDEAVDDPKLILLSDRSHRAWFNLMCLTSANDGSLPHIEIIAIKLRMPEKKLSPILEELVERGLLDDFDGLLRPHNWNGRQFKSDTDQSNADRQKRWRERNADRNVTRNVTNNTPREEQIQIADTESKKERLPAPKRRARTPLSTVDEWTPSSAALLLDFSGRELEKMRDWARSKGERRADWEATFRNWARRSAEQKSNGGTGGNDRSSNGFKDALGRLGDRIHELEDGNPEGGAAVVRLLPDRRRQ